MYSHTDKPWVCYSQYVYVSFLKGNVTWRLCVFLANASRLQIHVLDLKVAVFESLRGLSHLTNWFTITKRGNPVIEIQAHSAQLKCKQGEASTVSYGQTCPGCRIYKVDVFIYCNALCCRGRFLNNPIILNRWMHFTSFEMLSPARIRRDTVTLMKQHHISQRLPTLTFHTSLYQQQVVPTEKEALEDFQETCKFLNLWSSNQLWGILEMERVAKNDMIWNQI